MCWSSNELKPMVSDGNFKIRKICQIKGQKFYSYYYSDFNYRLGKKYTIKKLDLRDNSKKQVYCISVLEHDEKLPRYVGYDGFHSYAENMCIFHKDYTDSKGNYSIHVYTPEDELISTFSSSLVAPLHCAVFEGYIPKGAIYYVNDRGEVYSNAIVITQVSTVC